MPCCSAAGLHSTRIIPAWFNAPLEFLTGFTAPVISVDATPRLHQLPPVENPDQELESWHQVFAGLSDKDIQEIESIALDRSHFMAQET